ncbi:MAG TPA: CocE/NonD family hydrolase [Vicinamibacterales bacterium]|nr:CocE/NonD family hydrolase [Vicinamibacterales bacterium]HPK70922.1 CocE/NonD family hydrolase [Vicinamibacterales bacterium]
MRRRARGGWWLAGIAAIVALGAAAVGAQRGQAPASVQAAYTKHEYRIPMRDGVRLFTAVYVPRDRSAVWPILLTRTPYGVAPYGPDAYKSSLGPSSPEFLRSGYIFVYQDVRGRMMSEGEFVNMRPHLAKKAGPADIDESTDAYDTIEWLLRNVPGHNGRVGMWGISYPGFYASAGMIDAHPALKAVSPQAPITDWFIGDDFHHNGALYLPHAFGFLSGFGRPRPAPTTQSGSRFDFGTEDGYRFYLTLVPLSNANALYLKDTVAFWNEMMAHETYDAFWQARNLRPHLRRIKPAVLTVGGWFDAEDLFGALETYAHVERNSPGATNTLVMGPWAHGGWTGDGDFLGDLRFGSRTGRFFQEHIEFPFFEHHLKDAPDPGLPEACVFETGRNQWRRLDAWPPAEAAAKALYLRPGGRLSWQPPSEASAFDEYISDPARPVPYINHLAIGMTREHMVDDQRFASRRPDVLTYATDVLDSDVTVAGPIRPSLQVSTTGTDSDWVVKLIDVHPESAAGPSSSGERALGLRPASRMAGYQQLVRGEVMRGKFRDSYEAPQPFVPGEVTRVEYVVPDVFHTFRAGHRIMVQIQSTWFPLVDLNPQTFTNIPAAAKGDFRKATQRVYRGQRAASHIVLSVLEGP